MNTNSSTTATAKGATIAEWPLVIEDHQRIQPSTSADSLGSISLPFTVPAGHQANVSLSLGVDDWGEAWIAAPGDSQKLAHIDLLESADHPAGELGGHRYWQGSSNAVLPAGDYVLHVSQSNIDMDDPGNNACIWNYKMEATLS